MIVADIAVTSTKCLGFLFFRVLSFLALSNHKPLAMYINTTASHSLNTTQSR